MTSLVIRETASGVLTPTKQGKVRDIYDLGDRLLIVATDRISAFDVVLPDGIPDKGRVLTQISVFWFRRLAHIIGHHVISTSIEDFPEPFRSSPEIFGGRSMLVKKTRPLAVECVVRGYIAGSGWSDYIKNRAICGIPLPAGLHESDRLPAPIFTPSTKADIGLHDENISFENVIRLVGEEVAVKLRDVSLSIYNQAATYAETKGIIVADTKFEFGLDESGAIIWIDEALTPDSSRFWPLDQYSPGKPQPSFDKQFVRDYLQSIKWNKTPPAPRLPEDVIATSARKYEEALERLTGSGIQ